MALRHNLAISIIPSTAQLASLSIKQNSSATNSCYDYPITTFCLLYNPRLTGTFNHASNYHAINPNSVPCS